MTDCIYRPVNDLFDGGAAYSTMPRSSDPPDCDWFDSHTDQIAIQRGDSFLTAYPLLLRAFEQLQPSKEERLVLLIHAVYGWMPTMLDLQFSTKSERNALIGALRHLAGTEGRETEINAIGVLYQQIGTVPKKNDKLKDGKTKRGKSIVAVSKLLHFSHPTRWPIWDQRVATHWRRGRHSKKKAKAYWEYADQLRTLAESPPAKAFGIRERVQEKLKRKGYHYGIGPIRAFEMVLFYQPE